MKREKRAERIGSGAVGPVGFSLGDGGGETPAPTNDQVVPVSGSPVLNVRDFSFLQFLLLSLVCGFLFFVAVWQLAGWRLMPPETAVESGSEACVVPDKGDFYTFEGPKLYQQTVSGEKTLLSATGMIKRLDWEAGMIVIENNGSSAEYEISRDDRFQSLVYEEGSTNGFPFVFGEIDPEEIQIGDVISLNSENKGGVIVRSWIVQKQP